MKRIVYFLGMLTVMFSACQKDPVYPDVAFSSFALTEYPEIAFRIDKGSDPQTISNIDLLPVSADLSNLVVDFTLTSAGSVWTGGNEVIPKSSTLDFTSPRFIKTQGPDGITDIYYQVIIHQMQAEAPMIEKLDFQLDPNRLTPLAGLLELELSKACQLEITVVGQDDNDFTKTWDTPAADFSVPVLGLYPGFQNQVLIKITDQNGTYNTDRLFIKTDPLPDHYPELELLQAQADKAEPGFYFLHLERLMEGLTGDRQSFLSMIDNYGKVRWMYRGAYANVFTRLWNGNWIMGLNDKAYEIDMLGKRQGFEIEVPGFHHDAIEIPGGNILALGQYEDSFEDVMFEFDRVTGYKVKEWDFRTILDTARPKNPGHPNPIDWFHNNAVTFDSIDNAFIISGRNQSALVKIDYETSEIIWILGNHENWAPEYEKYLLTPVGDDFEWQWGQHAPMLSFQSNRRIICFDNGSNRSWDAPLAPIDNYSRGVEYEINEETMEVSQLWQYGKERRHELFTAYISDADYLPVTDNRLICFGGILKNLNGEAVDVFGAGGVSPAKNEIRLIEVSTSGEVIFELKIASTETNLEGYRSYRAEKISLYPKPK